MNLIYSMNAIDIFIWALAYYLVLKIVKRLLDTGVSLQNIRTAVEHLRSRGVSDLESITLREVMTSLSPAQTKLCFSK